jgi:hypothetical protein
MAAIPVVDLPPLSGLSGWSRSVESGAESETDADFTTPGINGQPGLQFTGGAGTTSAGFSGGGGGGGWYGGGGGEGYGAGACVAATGGGGGSGHGLNGSTLASGSGGTPPDQASPYYVAGVAVGTTGAGGNGLVAITY